MYGLTNIIEQCIKIIISPKTKKIIYALYIGGSLKPEDRIESSDIDIIGFVKDNFPIEFEKDFNRQLQNEIHNMQCKLRIIYISEIKGGKPKSFIATLLPIRLFLRRLPCFPLIWGKEIDLSTTIGPYSYREELKVQTKLIQNYINRYNSDNPVPFEWIPKAILYISAVELVLKYKSEYTTSFSEIEKQFKDEKSHIVHESMILRLKNYRIEEKEKDNYLVRVLDHLDELNI
jgi:hypothetical protein